MAGLRILITIIILIAVVAGFFVFPSAWNWISWFFNNNVSFVKLPQWNPQGFSLGLDLQGGTHLVYELETKDVSDSDREDAINAVRDVIERRVNLFGVAEPLVQIQNPNDDKPRLIVELAGISDVAAAINEIGETPVLEFKELPGDFSGTEADVSTFANTGLTGRHLVKAQLDFDQTTRRPQVSLEFNEEGADLFEQITSRNIGRPVAIFLDGSPISIPTVQGSITDGRAVITGQFTTQEARQLADRMNAGALPVPIHLVSQQTIGPSLGVASLEASLRAGLIALIVLGLFMIFWYRLPGLYSVFALVVYIVFLLAIFKLIPVTLTLAGIAGVIMSFAIALDANVLIFERMKEEASLGKSFSLVVQDGFARAWTSIRDSNLTTVLTTVILYWQGTGTVRGFALTLLIGTLLSMFTSITVTRSFLLSLVGTKVEQLRFLLRMPKVEQQTKKANVL
ncbi:protein translocase subunit SecD [Candidatus Parcubacteria bacterium]|nr:MAG: protein translocase subunit SecD [Candidatus Parcubacteria bacterium]